MIVSRLPRRPRVALYSHDARGLGHVRRNLAIAAVLAAGGTRDVLLISGAKEAAAFASPPGVELLTLPALHKSANGDYRSRSLPLPALLRLRAKTICAALEEFAPDAFVVDKLPLGVKGELEPALDLLAENHATRLVLGLREILDDPASVAREWEDCGALGAMRERYDALWVYGDRRVFDSTVEYALDPQVAAKARFTGYLGRDPSGFADGRVRPSAREPAPGDLAVCLVGGGEDGFELAEAFARTALPDGMTGIILTGPFMPGPERDRLDALGSARSDMRVVGFIDDPGALIARAHSVVCMGGYNTVCELLHLGCRTLVVPRVLPRVEQLIRARRLSAHGVLEYLHPEALCPDALAAWSAAPVRQRPHPADVIDLGGLGRIPALLDELLSGAREEAGVRACG